MGLVSYKKSIRETIFLSPPSEDMPGVCGVLECLCTDFYFCKNQIQNPRFRMTLETEFKILYKGGNKMRMHFA